MTLIKNFIFIISVLLLQAYYKNAVDDSSNKRSELPAKVVNGKVDETQITLNWNDTNKAIDYIIQEPTDVLRLL